MNRSIILVSLFIIIGFSNCQKDIAGIEHNEELKLYSNTTLAQPQNSGPSIINFNEENLFPEGLAYDAVRNWFYVSSATTGTIGIVKADGQYQPFISDILLTGTTGLKIDRARQRLWVANTENGVGLFSLITGNRVFFRDLSSLLPGAPVFINDITLDPRGNAYITNSFSPVIYRVDKEGNASVFFNEPALALNPGEFGLTGIQYDERGFLLAGYSDKIIKIPLHNPSNFSYVQLNEAVYPDGMLLSKDGKQLIVVHNTGGTPGDAVLSFTSNDQWSTGVLTTNYSTGPVFPTSAASNGKEVFVLYSHLDILLSGGSTGEFTIKKIELAGARPF